MNDQPEKTSVLQKWGPLVVLALALAIIIIDSTLLNVAFGTLVRDLNANIKSLQWVITAYALMLAAFTITGGRLGDLYGRKKMFMLGAIIFAIGSLIASLSNNVLTMIAGEAIIEGIGAALMMPATASLLVSTYRGRERAIAMGVWGGIAAASSAVGPILGGWLTTNYSWRWGFRINVVIAAILLLGSILVKEYREKTEKPTIDIIGVILSSIGLLGVVFGIIESSEYGWLKAKEAFVVAGRAISPGGYSIVMPSIILGLIFLAIFLVWENKVAQTKNTPLISVGIFKNRQFSASIITTMVMALGQAGLIFSIPIFLQSVRGLDAYHTGLAFLPMSLAALFFAPFSAAVLSKKIAPKYLIQAGLLFATAATLLVRYELTVDSTAATLIPGMLLYGVGIGLMMAQVTNMTLSAVSVEEAGEASGISNTLRQIGASFGAAIIGAALLSALTTNLSDGIMASTVIPAQAKEKIAQAVSTQTSNVEFGGGAKMIGQTSLAVAAEITKISHQATTNANKVALLYGALFSFLGFLTSFWLPKSKNLEKNQFAAEH